MNGLEELGYRLIFGQPIPVEYLSYNMVRDASAAAHRHAQKYEVNLRRALDDMSRPILDRMLAEALEVVRRR